MSIANNQPPAPSRAENPTLPLSRAGALRASSDSNSPSRPEDEQLSLALLKDKSHGIGGVARHTVGIILLLTTVFLWTASQFLASAIRYLLNSRGSWSIAFHKRKEPFEYAPLADGERNETRGSTDENLHIDVVSDGDNFKGTRSTGTEDKVPAKAKINVWETASLSLEFSFLWFYRPNINE
ncbi:MAG: hypothetical protein Q9211_000854 [Gyalolechia sp. 1 TL-2023]